jgi:hypothetical protein
LIRDWANYDDYSFGYEGGQEYLEEAVFKTKRSNQNMKRLRKFINDSFESIKCFLMPHPGSAMAGKETFNGNWGVIDKLFVDQLKVLVPSLLAPENLSVKKIGGEEMTGEKLYSYMQFYLKLFQSSKIPTSKSTYESTVAKFLQDLVLQCADVYKSLMVNGSSTVATQNDFDILHLSSKNETIDFYDNEKKVGGNETIVSYRNSLIGEIGKIQNQQNQTFLLQMNAMNEAMKIQQQNVHAFEDSILKLEKMLTEQKEILNDMKANLLRQKQLSG